jgi:hypothetical protein
MTLHFESTSAEPTNGVVWDKWTIWPGKGAFKNAKNIPPKLKQQLGLP